MNETKHLKRQMETIENSVELKGTFIHVFAWLEQLFIWVFIKNGDE